MENAQLRAVIERHGPPNWEGQVPFEHIRRALEAADLPRLTPMVVLATRLGISDQLAEKAEALGVSSKGLLSRFVSASTTMIRQVAGGWFDRSDSRCFTAYWPFLNSDPGRAATLAITAAVSVLRVYIGQLLAPGERGVVIPEGRGLSFGLDLGDVEFALEAKDLTVVGERVRSATALTLAAEPGEIVCSSAVAEKLPPPPLELPGVIRAARTSRVVPHARARKKQEVLIVSIDSS